MIDQSEFQILELIGKGTTGEVYKAYNKLTKSYVAAKKIPKQLANQPGMKKYIETEYILLQKLKHNNIIRFVSKKETPNSYYYFIDYCNGGSLLSCLEKFMKIYGFPFTEKIVQYLMRQIIDAINYLHKNKIIHRDLKLDNILVKFYSESDLKNL